MASPPSHKRFLIDPCPPSLVPPHSTTISHLLCQRETPHCFYKRSNQGCWPRSYRPPLQEKRETSGFGITAISAVSCFCLPLFHGAETRRGLKSCLSSPFSLSDSFCKKVRRTPF